MTVPPRVRFHPLEDHYRGLIGKLRTHVQKLRALRLALRAAAEAGAGARDETQAQLAATEAAITQLLRQHHAHIDGVGPGPPGAVRRSSRFLL
jgi:hypothetical protein